VNDNDIKIIYNIINKYIKIPKKLIIRNNSFSYNNGTLNISINQANGIVVIQNWNGIPNINKIVTEFKKIFGDVYVTGNDYINARDYGNKYTEILNIKLPKNIIELPIVNVKQIKTIKKAKDTLKKIEEIKHNRKLDIESKNTDIKASIIKKYYNLFKIIKLNKFPDDIFVNDIFNIYYTTDLNEAIQFVKLLKIEVEIHRALELKSWKTQNLTFGVNDLMK